MEKLRLMLFPLTFVFTVIVAHAGEVADGSVNVV
jgi:hypothetical protein